MADPEWKKAQGRVKTCLSLFESKRKDFWFSAFVDTYAARGEIVQNQPADFWALYQGHYQLIEVKSCHQIHFPFKDVRPSQWAGIRRIEASGGSSCFLIARLPEWQWHYMDGIQLFKMKDAGVKSLPWNMMKPIRLQPELFIRGRICHVGDATTVDI